MHHAQTRHSTSPLSRHGNILLISIANETSYDHKNSYFPNAKPTEACRPVVHTGYNVRVGSKFVIKLIFAHPVKSTRLDQVMYTAVLDTAQRSASAKHEGKLGILTTLQPNKAQSCANMKLNNDSEEQ